LLGFGQGFGGTGSGFVNLRGSLGGCFLNLAGGVFDSLFRWAVRLKGG
jgi:hypothetical protein